METGNWNPMYNLGALQKNIRKQREYKGAKKQVGCEGIEEERGPRRKKLGSQV